MPAALDGADKHLIQGRGNESQRQLGKSRIKNRKIIFRLHCTSGEDLDKLVKYIEKLIVKLPMLIRSSKVLFLIGLLYPTANSLLNIKLLKEIKDGLRELFGPERFYLLISLAHPDPHRQQRAADFHANVVDFPLVKPLIIRPGKMPRIVAFPVTCRYAERKTVIFQQIYIVTFYGREVGFKIGENVAVHKAAGHCLQGRRYELNDRMVIQRPSLVNKKRHAVVFKIRPYIVLVSVDIRRDYRYVTISKIFFPDQPEYLPADKLNFPPLIRRRYDVYIIR